MKTVVLTCDSCKADLRDRSAALTLFDGQIRRDFCTQACFSRWARRQEAPAPVVLRRAFVEDSRMVWEWANDPVTRSNSFESGAISWETHEAWFANQDDLWVGWIPVGSVRRADGEISVNVNPDLRGRGYGTALIRAAGTGLRARIKEANTVSLKAFTAAGYEETSRSDGVVEMAWTC